MLAIPVLRSRVAPVLNWCSTVLIVPRRATGAEEGLETRFEDTEPFELLRRLAERAVSTLICGALTPDLLAYGEQLGFKIVYGIAGEVNEVINAYRQQQLDHPRFHLPGCNGTYRYRRRTQEGCSRAFQNQPMGKGEDDVFGSCVCPRCAVEIPHRRGVPCSQMQCPACEGPMTRKMKSKSDNPDRK